MLYDNKALKSIPAKVTNWSQAVSCKTESLFQFDARNAGVIAEGRLLGKSRHCIVDKENQRYHYMVFHVDIKKACKRKYLANGDEIEPDLGSKQKVNTGYLMSSYKNVSKEGKDLLPFKDLKELIQVKELQSLTKEKEESYHGQKVISFWFIENDFDGMELNDNTNVRCRTRGGKCYLESFTCLDTETKDLPNYTAAKPLGDSWTDKVLALKESKEEYSQGATSQGLGDSADDDEWDD